MSLLAYKLIAPTLLVGGLMLPAVTLWTAGQESDFTYGQDEDPYTHYLHPAPIMLPDGDGSYRSLIIKMKVRNFQSADTICRYFPRIRDKLFLQLQDYPTLLNQDIGWVDHGSIDLHGTVEKIIGKGRINHIQLVDREAVGSKKELHGQYKCYGKHAEIIVNKSGA